MDELDKKSIDSWLSKNASQRKALQSMLDSLQDKETGMENPEVDSEKRNANKTNIMKKITQIFKKLGFLAIVVWLAGSLNIMAQDGDFVPGKVRVKIEPNSVDLLAKSLNTTKGDAQFKTGLTSLDKINTRYAAKGMTRVFPHAGKNEAKHIKHGLHLWYEIEVTSEADMKAVAREYGGNEYIISSEPIAVKSLNNSRSQEAELPSAPSMAMSTNDPYLLDQWHLANDGVLEGSVAGADINAFKAWDINTGSPNVVVAVVDGGIDTAHEDLRDNLWVNEAELNGEEGVDDDYNGYIDDVYGYNFADSQGEVTAHDHGTHVAGTVAATNNNGKGVAGVAGGSGNGDGVRMISAQVFSDNGAGNFAAAIVYGADNGAVISQNSWGYQTPGQYEQAVIDAIDYFIEEAGNYPGSPMKGGVLFFAAGNNGRDQMHYPSYYDKTVAIASTGTDYKRAPYSNYGAWVDLTTTGGNVYQGSKSQVLSTLPGNRYGYMQGTSMATPHASGIAALVVSEYGGAGTGFTNEDLKKRLFTGVREIDSHNPGFEGMLGLGFMDAALALAANDEQGPETISDLTLLGASQDFATVQFTVPGDAGDDTPHLYRLQWSKDPMMDSTMEMVIENDFRSAGDIIEVTVEDLEFITTYYFTVVAEDRWGNVSEISNKVEATTNRGPDIASDITSLNTSIDITTASEALESITIQNNDEGILNWTAETRERSSSASYTNIALPAAGAVKSVAQLDVRQQLIEEVEKFQTRDAAPNAWEASDKNYYGYGTIYVIGDNDTTMTNSAATRFYVDEADGFNLTYVSMYMNLDQEDGPAVMEIYRGEEIHKDNLIYVDNRFNPYSENDSRTYGLNLNEQLFFEQGETFWIVFHTPAGNLYPLGMSPEASPEYSDNSLMSFDLGETWVPLAGAIEDENWVWRVQASSRVSPLHQYITLDPAEGQIAGIGEENVDVLVDGSQLINGTYRSNIVIQSNDEDTPIYRVPTEVVVSGHKPALSTTSILDFGSVFNGLSSTKEMVITNNGFGRFRTQSIEVSDPQFEVTSSLYSLNVAAKSEATMVIKFTPSGVGNKNAVITLTSQNGDVHTFNVFGVGTEPAQLTAAPTVINFDDVMIGDALQDTITLTNSGQYPLQYGFPAFAEDLSHIENLPENVQQFPYVMETTPYDTYVFNDITADGTDVTESFKQNPQFEYYQVDLGFDFPFFGESVSALNITKRGVLTLGEDSSFNASSEFHGSHMPEGYISALLREWALSVGGSIHYKRELGKFIVQYTDVRHANDRDNVAITFQIELYANGDIKFIYDKFDGLFAYQLNSFYSAIENRAKTDGVIVNSNRDDVSLPMAPQQIVHIHSPGIGLIKSVEEAAGFIQPGESKELILTVDGEKLTEGAHTEYISVLSNDPFKSAESFEININVIGGGVSEVVLSEDAVDFGDVFQMATVKGTIGVKNEGSRQVDISNISLANGQLTLDGASSVILEPNQTLYISYILNTDTLGAIADTLIITEGDGSTHEVAFSGNIVDAPGIEVVEASYMETMEPDTLATRSFMVNNTGKATLEYAIAATEHVTVAQEVVTNNVPDFTYVHRSTYDEVMKPSHQWIKLTEEDKVNFRIADQIIWEVIELPFDFQFYGESYNKLWMSSQGVLSFDEIEDVSLSYFTPPSIPNNDELNNIISPYFAAGGPDTTLPEDQWGRYVKAFDDKIVFEWRNYNNLFYIGGTFSIQAILYKNGKIKFQYKSDPNQPIRAFYGLIGIENKEGTDGTQIAYYQEYLNNGVAIDIFPAQKETLEPGASRTYDLTISTEGVNAGVYEESLKVFNNSPLTPEVTVPVDLTVTGEAELTFNPETIDLGEEMVVPGATYTANISFSNTGRRTMTVSNLRLEDATIAKIEHLVYNFRWGWQWTTLRATDSFTVEPGFESKEFRLTIQPTEPNDAYTNKVLADTDFGTIEELPITATFKLPPSFTVNDEAIYHMAYNEDVYSHVLNFGNVEGESPLSYTLGLNYLREEVTAVAQMQRTEEMALLSNKYNFEAPSLNVVLANVEFANKLAYENAEVPYTSVGYNGDAVFTAATEFIAPANGFNLSHIQTWYSYGSWLNSELDIEIRVGDQLEKSDILYAEKLNFNAESANNDGELITLELSEAVSLAPYEKFYVVISYPLGANYPQGIAAVEEGNDKKFKFTNGGFWYDIAGGGLPGYGWMIRAGELNAAQRNWLSVNGNTEGDVAVGETLDLEIQLHPARTSEVMNTASISIETNDPEMELVTIPVSLEINQAPVLNKEAMYFVNEADTLSITLEAIDREGDLITAVDLQGSNPNASLSFENDMVTFTYMPGYEDSGMHEFEIVLEDENGIEGVSTLNVEVMDVNRKPEAAQIPTQYINLYTDSFKLNFADVFADPDGDAIHFATSFTNENVVDLFENADGIMVTPLNLGSSMVTLTGTDTYGGEVSTSFEVVVIGNVRDDETLDQSWKVHPNPVGDVMNIKMYRPVVESVTLNIYNLTGVMVKTNNSNGSSTMMEVPVEDLVPGIYFVEMVTKNAKSVKKIIKN